MSERYWSPSGPGAGSGTARSGGASEAGSDPRYRRVADGGLGQGYGPQDGPTLDGSSGAPRYVDVLAELSGRRPGGATSGPVTGTPVDPYASPYGPPPGAFAVRPGAPPSGPFASPYGPYGAPPGPPVAPPSGPFPAPGPGPHGRFAAPAGIPPYVGGLPHGAPYRPAVPRGGGVNGVALAGVILGGLGLVLSFVPVIGLAGWPLVLLGIGLSVFGLSRAGERGGRGLAVGGIVTSSLGLVVSLVMLIVFVATLDTSTVAGPGPSPSAPTVPGTGSGTQGQGNAAVAFGEAVAYDNGVELSVSAPRRFVPSSSSAGADDPGLTAFTVDVTLRNSGAAPIVPTRLSVAATVDGREADPVYDTANGISVPRGTVQPGRSLTWTVGFATTSAGAEAQIDLSPGYGSDTATFAGRF